jgi:hypothetical protein
MPGAMRLATIVSLIVIGVVVLVGILGYLIETSSERTEHKPEGNGA